MSRGDREPPFLEKYKVEAKSRKPPILHGDSAPPPSFQSHAMPLGAEKPSKRGKQPPGSVITHALKNVKRPRKKK